MTKKLNTDHIRSELADSVFFWAPRPVSTTLAPEPVENPSAPPAPAIPERPNG